MAQNCHEREPQGTHHVHERDQVACDVGHAATQRLHGVKNLALRRPGLRRRRIEAVHVPQETLIPLGQSDDVHLVAARFPRTQQSFQQQRAIGVELLDGAHVDCGYADRGRVRGKALHQTFEFGRIGRGPCARRGQPNLSISCLRAQERRPGHDILLDGSDPTHAAFVASRL